MEQLVAEINRIKLACEALPKEEIHAETVSEQSFYVVHQDYVINPETRIRVGDRVFITGQSLADLPLIDGKRAICEKGCCQIVNKSRKITIVGWNFYADGVRIGEYYNSQDLVGLNADEKKQLLTLLKTAGWLKTGIKHGPTFDQWLTHRVVNPIFDYYDLDLETMKWVCEGHPSITIDDMIAAHQAGFATRNFIAFGSLFE